MKELLTNFGATENAIMSYLRYCFPSALSREDFEDAIVVAFEKLFLDSLKDVPTLEPTIATMRYLAKLACIDAYRKKLRERKLIVLQPLGFEPNFDEDSADILAQIEQKFVKKTALQKATFEKFHLFSPQGKERMAFKNGKKVSDKMLAQRFNTTVGYVKQVRYSTLAEIREAMT